MTPLKESDRESDKMNLVEAAEKIVGQVPEVDRLSQVFAQAPAQMAILRGPQHVYEMTNPPYQRLIGGRNVIGLTVAEAMPEVAEQGYVALLDEVFASGIAYVATDVTVVIQPSPGGPSEEVTVDFTYQPLFDDAGTVTGILSHGIDRTVQKRQERAFRVALDSLRVTEERYRALFETIDIGFCIIEMIFVEDQAVDYKFVEINPAFARHTGLHGAIGKTILELAPNIDPSWFTIYGSVVLSGEPARFQNHDPALSRWFDVYAQRVGEATEKTVAIFFTDITATRQHNEALRNSEERLRDAQTRLTAALSAGSIATWTLDLVANRLLPDTDFARLFGAAPEFASGGHFNDYLNVIHSEDRAIVVDAIGRAITDGIPYEAEYRVVLPNGSIRWLSGRGTVDRDTQGKPVSMPGVIVDISERIEREQREKFLTELTVQTSALLDPEDVLFQTARAVGEQTEAHRALYAEVDDDADTFTVRRDHVVDSVGIPSMAGTFPLSSFGLQVAAQLRAGEVTQSADIDVDPRLDEESRTTFRNFAIRAFLSVPLRRAGRLVAILSIQQSERRHWTDQEIELLRQVGERTWLAVENARLFRDLEEESARRREQGEYLRRLLESSPDCIKTLDLDGRILSLTDGARTLMEVDDDLDVCGLDWGVFWSDDARDAYDSAMASARAGGLGRFQGFCPTLKGTPRWWDVVVSPILGASGEPEQLLGVARDITDQKLAEERELARLTNIFMRAPAFMATMRGPDHVFELANPTYLRLVGSREIIGKPAALALPEIVDQGFIALLDQVYRTGEPYVGTDISIRLESRSSTAQEERFLDFTYQPLLDDDGAVSGILAHGIDLTARKLLEQERERLLDEQRQLLAQSRARAERETLLNRIGSAIRNLTDTEAIMSAVVTMLGDGMKADRCYILRTSLMRDQWRVEPEWIRPGLDVRPLAEHVFRPSAYPLNPGADYEAGRTQTVNDVAEYAPKDAAAMRALDLRSLLCVVVESNSRRTSLTVAMANEARDWTDGEVRLLENVGALVSAALESVRTQQRERTIALQLQEALQPAAPADRPGLSLASFYRPALGEASVGGDFFDVFRVREGCTALVVADLSGKGLAAASQVATVRNMLRYAVYSSGNLADSITDLHRKIVEHELLTGFATLFVGVFDEEEKSLAYVNCGQEPGLIWRAATGDVEYLEPTGPVLGGFGRGDFAERTVRLSAGDVISLFTDGLTEVGPTRKLQLEIDGVSQALRACCARAATDSYASPRPQAVVDQLISRIDEFARGGVPDDIALLVGVVGV